MSGKTEVSIHTLIERSSLGTKRARVARARVPLATGEAVVRAAAARADDRRGQVQRKRSRQG